VYRTRSSTHRSATGIMAAFPKMLYALLLL